MIRSALSQLIETPSGKDIPSDKSAQSIQDRIRRTFLKTFSELSKVINDLKSYINTESKSGDYFSETISEIVNQTHQFLIGISQEKRVRLLFGDPGKHYSMLLLYIKELCAIILKYSKDNQIKLTFSTIETGCNKSENEIIIVSVAIYDINPPDQRDESSTELEEN